MIGRRPTGEPFSVATWLLAVFLATVALGVGMPLTASDIAWRRDSTQPVVQLTGEHFQIFSNGVYFTAPTPGRTVSQAGLLGADLGYPLSAANKVIFFFGDSSGLIRGGPRRPGAYARARMPNGNDSFGFIPTGDWSACDYIARVDAELGRGHARAAGVDGGMSRADGVSKSRTVSR